MALSFVSRQGGKRRQARSIDPYELSSIRLPATPEHGDLDSRVMTTTRPVAYDGGALIGLTDKASATA